MIKTVDTPNTEQGQIISKLESQISMLNKEKASLKKSLLKFSKTELRYHNIFKNSSVALWEEDFSAAYTILNKLPCKTKEEYSEYLEKHPELFDMLFATIKILDVNDATLELYGAENKKELIYSFDKIFRRNSYKTLRDQFASFASGEHQYKCELILHKINGEKFHVLLTSFFPNNKGEKVFITTMDIDDRIEIEKKQAILLQETEEKRKIADILMEITFELSLKTDQNDILDTILEQTEKLVPYSSANIMLIEDNKLIVSRHRGYNTFGADEFVTKAAADIAILGSVKSYKDNKQTQIIDDTREYTDWNYFPETAYIRSILSMPIQWQGEIIGLLNLDSNRINNFSQRDIKVLTPISQAAAISIQKAQLLLQTENEIKERITTEQELSKSLKDKELLLQEIHHRVKNNLSIIIALINLQDTNSSNSEEEKLFEELNQRIYSIALVHEKLYENFDLSSIDFSSYAVDLFNSIISIMVFRSDISFDIDIPDNIYFSMDRLIPLGLTLNELLTNSLKYAFIKTGGSILLKLEIQGDYYILSIEDSGIGYPKHILEGNHTQLGLTLVSALVEQINGTILFSNNNGALVSIKFPVLEKSK